MATKVLGYVNVIKRSGKDGSRFPVTEDSLIGSGIHCEIRIYLPEVAVEHCLIQCHETGRCYLKNLCPINPITLNGSEIMGTAVLNHGDVIGLSDRVLRWEYEGHTETPSKSKPTMSLLSVSSDDLPGQSKRPMAVVPPQVRDRNSLGALNSQTTSQSLRTWVLRRSVGDALSSRSRYLGRTPDSRRRTSKVHIDVLRTEEETVDLEVNQNGKRKSFTVFAEDKPLKKRRTNSVTAMQSPLLSHHSTVEREILMEENTLVTNTFSSVHSPTKNDSKPVSTAKQFSSRKKTEVDIPLEKTSCSPKVFYGKKSNTSPFEVLPRENNFSEIVSINSKSDTSLYSMHTPVNQTNRRKSASTVLGGKGGNVASVSPTGSCEKTLLSLLNESTETTPSNLEPSRKSKGQITPRSSESLEIVAVLPEQKPHKSKRKSSFVDLTADLSESYSCESKDLLEIESSEEQEILTENSLPSIEECTPHSYSAVTCSTPHSVGAMAHYSSSRSLVTPLSRSARGRKSRASLPLISAHSSETPVSKTASGVRKTVSVSKSTPHSQKLLTGRVMKVSQGTDSVINTQSADKKRSMRLSRNLQINSTPYSATTDIGNRQEALLSDNSTHLLSMQKYPNKRTSRHSFKTPETMLNLPGLLTPGKQSVSHKGSIAEKLSPSPNLIAFESTSKGGTFTPIETPQGSATIIRVVEETPTLHDRSITSRRQSSKVKQLIQKFDKEKPSNPESVCVTLKSSSRSVSHRFSGTGLSTPSSKKSAQPDTLDEVSGASVECSKSPKTGLLIEEPRLSSDGMSRKSQKFDVVPSVANGSKHSTEIAEETKASLTESTPQRKIPVELNSRSGTSEGLAPVLLPASSTQKIKSSDSVQSSEVRNVSRRSKTPVDSPIRDRPKRKSAGLLLAHIRASQESFSRKSRRNSTPTVIAQTGSSRMKSPFILSKATKVSVTPVVQTKTPLKRKLLQTASGKKTLSGKSTKRRLTNVSLLDATANTLKVESPKTPDKKKMAALLQCHKPRMLFSEVLKNAPPKKQDVPKPPSLPIRRRKKLMKKTKAHTPKRVLIKGIGSTGHVDSPETIVIHGKQSKALKLQRAKENQNLFGVSATTSGWKHVQTTEPAKNENVGKTEPDLTHLIGSRKSVSFSPAPQVVAFAASRRISTRKSLKMLSVGDNELHLQTQASRRASILKKTPSMPVETEVVESRSGRSRNKKSCDYILSSTPVRGSVEGLSRSRSVQLQTHNTSGKQVVSPRRFSRFSSVTPVSHTSSEILNNNDTSQISTTFDFDACATPSISMDKFVSPLSVSRKKKREDSRTPILNESEPPSKKFKKASVSKHSGEWQYDINSPLKNGIKDMSVISEAEYVSPSVTKVEKSRKSATNLLNENETKGKSESPSLSKMKTPRKSASLIMTRTSVEKGESVSTAHLFLETDEIEQRERTSKSSRKSLLNETENGRSAEQHAVSFRTRKSTDDTQKQKLVTSQSLSSSKSNLKGTKAAKSAIKSARLRNLPSNDLTDVSGMQRLFRSSRKPVSPKNDLTGVKGVRRLFKHTSPSNNLSDLTGVSTLFNSPEQNRSIQSPRLRSQQKVQTHLPESMQEVPAQSEVIEIESTNRISKSSRKSNSVLTEMDNKGDVKRKSRSGKSTGSMVNLDVSRNDLGSSACMPSNDFKDMKGTKQMLKSQTVASSPYNDLSDARGVKALFRSPRKQISPSNDLTDVRGVRQLFNLPESHNSPKNDLSDLTGVDTLFSSPEEGVSVQSVPCEPMEDHKNQSEIEKSNRISRSTRKSNTLKNEISNTNDTKRESRSKKSTDGVVNLGGSNASESSVNISSSNNDFKGVKGTKRVLKPQIMASSPNNDLSDVAAVKVISGSAKKHTSPENDLTGVRGVQRLLKSPRRHSTQENNLSDLTGVSTLFSSPEQNKSVQPIQLPPQQKVQTLCPASVQEETTQSDIKSFNRISRSSRNSSSLINEIANSGDPRRQSRSRRSTGNTVNVDDERYKSVQTIHLQPQQKVQTLSTESVQEEITQSEMTEVKSVNRISRSSRKSSSLINEIVNSGDPPRQSRSRWSAGDVVTVDSDPNKSVQPIQLQPQQKGKTLSTESVQDKTTQNEMTEITSINRISRSSRKSGSLITEIANTGDPLRQSRSRKSTGNTVNVDSRISELDSLESNKDLKDTKGAKRVLKSQTAYSSPYNDLSDVRGVKTLFRSPRKHISPKNELTDVRGVKKLFRSPERHFSPKNDLSDVTGVSRLFSSPEPNESLHSESQKEVVHILSAEQANESDNELNAAAVEASKKMIRTEQLPTSCIEKETGKRKNRKANEKNGDKEVPEIQSYMKNPEKPSQSKDILLQTTDEMTLSPITRRSRKKVVGALRDKLQIVPPEPLNEKPHSSSGASVEKFEVQKDLPQASHGGHQLKPSPPRTRRGKKQTVVNSETILSDKAVAENQSSSHELTQDNIQTASDRSPIRTRGGRKNNVKQLNVGSVRQIIVENSPRTRSRGKLVEKQQDELSLLHGGKKLKSSLAKDLLQMKSKHKKVVFSDDTQVILLENISPGNDESRQHNSISEAIIEESSSPVNNQKLLSSNILKSQQQEALASVTISSRTRKGKRAEITEHSEGREPKLVTASQTVTGQNTDTSGEKLHIHEEYSRTRSRRKPIHKVEEVPLHSGYKKLKSSGGGGESGSGGDALSEKSESVEMVTGDTTKVIGVDNFSSEDGKQQDIVEEPSSQIRSQKLGSTKLSKLQQEKSEVLLPSIANSPRTRRGGKTDISDLLEKEKTLPSVTRAGTRRNRTPETQMELQTAISQADEKISKVQQQKVQPSHTVNLVGEQLSSLSEASHVRDVSEQPRRGRKMRKEIKGPNALESTVEIDVSGAIASVEEVTITAPVLPSASPIKPRRKRGATSKSSSLEIQQGEQATASVEEIAIAAPVLPSESPIKPRRKRGVTFKSSSLEIQQGEQAVEILMEGGGKCSQLIQKEGNQLHNKTVSESVTKLESSLKKLPVVGEVSGMPRRGRRNKKETEASSVQDSSRDGAVTGIKESTEEVTIAVPVTTVENPVKPRRRGLTTVTESKKETKQPSNTIDKQTLDVNDNASGIIVNPVSKRPMRGRKRLVDQVTSVPAKQEVSEKVSEIKNDDETTGSVDTRTKKIDTNKDKVFRPVKGIAENMNINKEVGGVSRSPRSLRGRRGLRNRDDNKIVADGLQQMEEKMTDSVPEINTIGATDSKQNAPRDVNKSEGDIAQSSDKTHLRTTRRKRKALEEKEEPVKKKTERLKDASPKETVSVRSTRQCRKY